ncbi:hypothetical protein [Ruania alba]|uniref:Uncharacterized protein n=1 Tax=Ruania alba TaxID=648782 RepID=A0A1H5LGK7_9MICO|nr:hypothetical protein [Ruania alba]SEE76124.1 hypothetical protein SAMN04488554_2799 [Ruania alba]
MARPSFYRRRFLNRRGHHAGAYALAQVRTEASWEPGSDDRRVDAQLTLADCGRVVSLEFDVDTAGDARNALYKARLLRSIIIGFTEALEQAVAETGHQQ